MLKRKILVCKKGVLINSFVDEIPLIILFGRVHLVFFEAAAVEGELSKPFGHVFSMVLLFDFLYLFCLLYP